MTDQPEASLADQLEAAFRGYTFTPADPLATLLPRVLAALRENEAHPIA